MPIPVPPKRSRTLGHVVALLPALLLVTGCGAGFDAQTNQPYQAAEGANGDSGPIAARNVLIVADEAGKGELHGVLVNSGDTDDRLASIQVDAEGVKLTGAEPAPLPAGKAVAIGPVTSPASEAGEGESGSKAVTVTGAKPGRMIKLTISFGTAGPITTNVPVITEDHYSPTPRPAAEG